MIEVTQHRGRTRKLTHLQGGLAHAVRETWDADVGMDWEAFYNNFRKPGFIAGYEIQNRLGGGAFGDVYKARKQSIGKAYAIKFLKIEDDTQRAAVERELSQVRHFAAIDHPNLVSIEDLGTVMEVPFLIMGYAGEDTLARRLQGGALDPERALLYFTQACRGVLALHDRRLVHFDLKPSNIFLKGDAARVGDYGLSKLLTDGRMTLSYGRGTPQYMAPEMLRNRADQRADIYSLGVILFESLAGRLPFESDNPGGLVLREKDEPPPFPADFPVRLRATVERCLRIAPEDRFATVEELLDSFEQTARPGDSVRLDWEAPTEPAGEEDTSELETTKEDSGSAEDLRRTAAELARGAVEVARGVWDGLRSQEPDGTEAAPTSRSETKSSPKGMGNLRKELEGARRDLGAASQQVHGAVAAARAAGKRLREKRGEEQPAGAESGFVSPIEPTRVMAAPASAAAPLATIPVPPRVEGGLVGTLLATSLLGLEVLVALVGSVLHGSARFARSIGDWLARSGGFLGQVFRVMLFVVVMALLGAAVMTAGLLFLGGAPPS